MCPWNPSAGGVSSHLAQVEEPFPPHQYGHNHPSVQRVQKIVHELLSLCAGTQSTQSPTTLMPVVLAMQNSRIPASRVLHLVVLAHLSQGVATGSMCSALNVKVFIRPLAIINGRAATEAVGCRRFAHVLFSYPRPSMNYMMFIFSPSSLETNKVVWVGISYFRP